MASRWGSPSKKMRIFRNQALAQDDSRVIPNLDGRVGAWARRLAGKVDRSQKHVPPQEDLVEIALTACAVETHRRKSIYGRSKWSSADSPCTDGTRRGQIAAHANRRRASSNPVAKTR